MRWRKSARVSPLSCWPSILTTAPNSSTITSCATAASAASASPGAALTKKNDNAHIEQKNWTHVRRIFRWDRFDTPEQQHAMNALYRQALRLMMNAFQPCVKLVAKERTGSRLKRVYDPPQTPLERLQLALGQTPATTRLLAVRDKTDPFALDDDIQKQRADIDAQRKEKRNNAD